MDSTGIREAIEQTKVQVMAAQEHQKFGDTSRQLSIAIMQILDVAWMMSCQMELARAAGK